MSLNEEVELLKTVPLFAKMEPAKLKLLAFTSERLSFAPGQLLFNEGDVGDAAYVIIDGEADVLIDTSSGKTRVATLPRNAIVGEIAILCDVPRTATVVAKSPLVVLRLHDVPAAATEAPRQLAVRRQARDGVGDARRVVGRGQQTRLLVPHELADPRDGAAHDRTSGRHRLHEDRRDAIHVAGTVPAARQHEDVAGAHAPRHRTPSSRCSSGPRPPALPGSARKVRARE